VVLELRYRESSSRLWCLNDGRLEDVDWWRLNGVVLGGGCVSSSVKKLKGERMSRVRS